MKSVIILHGMPGKEEYFASGQKATAGHWFPWIKTQLEDAGVVVHIPEMPEPYEPDYQKWSAVFEQLPVDENTMLVGHSCGGGFLVRWLSEHTDVKVGKVVLVAPWIDPNHKWAPKMFDGFEIDENVAERTKGITEFISMDDDNEELISLEVLKKKVKGLELQVFTDKGHFTFGDMHTNEFSELRDFLLA